jgi:hypothetical protein
MPTVVPRLVRRASGLFDLAIKNRPGVIGYRLSAANALDTAYTAPTAFLDVRAGDVFSSPTIQRNRAYRMDSSNRGLTRLWLDINDYASASIPGDDDVCFLRISEETSGGFLEPGPILVVPPPDFFETGRRNLMLAGTAPSLASRGNNLPPAAALRVFFPKFADELKVYNEEAVGGNDLYFSLGPGLNEMRVSANSSRGFSEAGANEFLIRGAGGAVSFSISAAIVNGIQA